MKILNLENGQINITEELLIIPEFKAIWDKHKDKEKARKEFLYIYFYADSNSPYKNYDPKDRQNELIKDYSINVDSITEAGINKYKDLNYTFNMRYLEAAMEAANKTIGYFKQVDYSLIDIKGNPVYRVKEVTDALKNCMGVITTLESLRDKIESENIVNSKIRGGGKISKWEQ
jgi:hypothetical protein